MDYHQLNLSIPEEIYQQLKRWIPRGQVTDFVLEWTRLGLHHLRFKKAAQESFGAWSAESHPELSQGTQAYLRKLRKGRKF